METNAEGYDPDLIEGKPNICLEGSRKVTEAWTSVIRSLTHLTGTFAMKVVTIMIITSGGS